MANLTPTPGGFSPNVYRLETTDPVLGGETGVMNKQAKQLIANDIDLKAIADSAGKRALRNVQSINTLGDPLTLGNFLNGSVIYLAAGTDQFNLIDITNNVAFPEAPADGVFTAGRVSWTRVINGGIAINKPAGMVMYYSGADLVSGDADDTGSPAVIWVQSGAVVDIYVKNNTALVTANLPSTGPGFKTGMMVKWGTVAAVLDTTWWINCDGTAISRSTYAELFAVIGTAYGVGDGTTTFNIPNDPGFMIRHRD